MENIILYNYFRSSTSFRVRIALNLKKIKYEYKPIHLLNNGGEQNTTEYRKLNPMGGVPTLVHTTSTGTATIAQSYAIIEYLEEAFPQNYLLLPHTSNSKNIELRAHIRQFCQIINADIHAYGNLKTLQYLEKDLLINGEKRTEWTQHFISQGLDACEKTLKNFGHNNGPFCFGDRITAADCFLIPQLVTAERFGIDIKKYSLLFKIYENCLKQEAFIQAHPFRQIDTPMELRI